MPITIESTYSKKLGLPGFSSHSYSVTVRSEVTDLSQVDRESAKLYALLQSSVDRELQEIGFIPEESVALQPHRNGKFTPRPKDEAWSCSDKQRDLILKIVEEHRLEKQEIEELAKDRFNLPVKSLNKLQASGLIEELLEKHGPKKANGNGNRSYQRGGSRR